MRALYDDVVLSRRDGALQRSPRRWARALGLHHDESPWWVGAFDEQGELVGYVSWHMAGTVPELTAVVDDVVLRTAAAAAALRYVLSQLSTTVETVTVSTAPDDPFFWASPFPRSRTRSMEPFLMRTLDPARAVETWGFAKSVSRTLHFSWSDELFPQDDGPVTLAVDQGRGVWSREGPGGPTLTPGVLSALLAGRVDPEALPVLGGPVLPRSAEWAEVFPRRTAFLRDDF